MSRIPTPASISDAPSASQPLLEAVKKQLGTAPNMFRLISNSPAALEGYLALSGALNKGRLPAQTRERIALAVAEINGCDLCLSAHAYLGEISPSSMTPKSLRTAAALRITSRPIRGGFPTGWWASAVMSVKTTFGPSSPPVMTMRR